MDNAEYLGDIIRVEKSNKKKRTLDKPIWDFEDYHRKHYKIDEKIET